jgi:uncharacterized protein YjbI with pentapeptide repeats
MTDGKVEIKKIEGVSLSLDSFGYCLEDADIDNCSITGGTHDASYMNSCMIINSKAKESFFRKLSLELVSFTNCKFDAMSVYSADLDRCIFDSCTFEDCSFGAITFTETNFINCKLDRCSFNDTSFDVLDETKTKVFNNCKVIKCQLADCTFNGSELDGRLCEVKNYSASLNLRLFSSTNIHGTKMYHSNVVCDSRKRRHRGKGKGRNRKMIFSDSRIGRHHNRGHEPAPDDDGAFYGGIYGDWGNTAAGELMAMAELVDISNRSETKRKCAHVFSSPDI